MPRDPNLMPDFSKENQYEFVCGGCGGHFLGHKGRCICDVCKLLEEDDAENDAAQECEDEDDFDCGLRHDGQCGSAGTEYCDFECPNRESELFAGSAAWNKKHGT